MKGTTSHENKNRKTLFALAALLLPGVVYGAAHARPRQDAAKTNGQAAVAGANQTPPKVEKDVNYGTTGDPKQTLDTYALPFPEEGRPTVPRPGIVLIHGGGWAAGDKKFYDPLALDMAKRGYDVFNLNYRLSGQAHYPAQIDDVQRAVRWIRAHAAHYDLDPARIGALGDSAGAHLSALLATRDTRDNSDADLAKYSSRVQCVIDFYGPSDFQIPPSDAGFQGGSNPVAMAILAQFFGKTPQEAPELYKDGSPMAWVDKSSAPFLIIHGTTDTLVPQNQSERLHTALKKAGVESTLLLAYGYPHGFLNPGSPSGFGALAVEFFARHLKP